MSIFTSRLPSEHGVHNVAAAVEGAAGTVVEVGHERFLVSPVPDAMPTLADVLRFRGFATAAFTDGGNVSPVHGFARGFEHYTSQLDGASDDARDALAWLRARGFVDDDGGGAPAGGPRRVPGGDDEAPRRFFMFWHTYQIHSPYAPPLEYIERFAPADYKGPLRPRVTEFARRSYAEQGKGRDDEFWEGKPFFTEADAAFLHGAYRGGVRHTDDILAGLFDHLRREGVLDRSIVVLLSDHGEEFKEHGGFGHMDVFDECTRVPLMVRLPGGVGGGRRIETPVSLVDVMPTVLDLLDVGDEVTERMIMTGRSLAPYITGAAEPSPVPITAEVKMLRGDRRLWEWRGAHWIDGAKFLWLDEQPLGSETWQPGRRLLYDLDDDPGETTDLAAQGDPRLPRMLDWHADWRRRMQERAGQHLPGAANLTPEQLEQLRRLGYVDTDDG